MRRSRYLPLFLALAILPAGHLSAQTVTGTITSEPTGEPIAAAWVVLVDSLATERTAVLTDPQGRFRLRAPHSGSWIVRVNQLGYAERVSDPVVVAAGATRDVPLELRPRALPLEELSVEVERRCNVEPAEGSAAAVLWEEARKGLSAVRWTGRSALVAYRIHRYERTLDLTGRRLTETGQDGVSRGERPFTTPPPSDLARDGFVQREDTTASFYAPDAEVLLSDEFAGTHCFRARRGRGETSAMVGLEFEPAPGHDLPDISGTLWIDTLTSALRYLEFHYTGIDYGMHTRELGGRIDFGRLPSGAWITERWHIRGPVIARATAGDVRRLRGAPLVGFKEVGAELVSIVTSTRSQPPDTSRGTPASGASAPGHERLESPLVGLGAAVDRYAAAVAAAPADADDEVSTRAKADAAARLRFGFEALDRYANGRERGDYVAALAAFTAAQSIDPTAAVAWYGEGLAHAHGPELEIPDATGYQHRRVYAETNAELSARRAFAHAIELDPGATGPALELAALALATRKPSTLDTADAAITTVLEHGGDDAMLLAAASLVAAAQEDFDRAIDLGRRAVEDDGGSVTLHALGSALVRVDGREEEGAATYMRGIDRLDEAGAVRYWDDARFIARPRDQFAWHDLSPSVRGVFLRSLWERSAGENAMTPGERLAVHLQRLDTAQTSYRRQALRGARPFDALSPDTAATDLPIDARGMIYVRHGPPDRVITSIPDRRGLIGPNVTWIYNRGRAPAVFHFMKMEANADWQLSAGPPCDPLYYRTGEHGARALTSLNGPVPVTSSFNYMEAYERWYADRSIALPEMYGDAVRCLTAARRLDAAIERHDQEAIQDAISEIDAEQRDWSERRIALEQATTESLMTEDAILEFDSPLNVLTSLYTFRGPDGNTDVIAAVLVPGDGFTPMNADAGVAYAVRLSLILMDPPHERVFRTDTVMAYGSDAPIATGRYLRTFAIAHTSPMDTMDFRLAVRNDEESSEGRVQSGRIPVPDYSGDAVSVSDLVIADPTTDGVWDRGFVRISPIPTHQIDTGSPFSLYYEVYNLEEGDALSTRIRIRPAEGSGLVSRIGRLFGGRKNEIDLRFDDVATEPGEYGLQYLREVGAELEAGSYIVTVTVRNSATGEESTRETRLNVNSPPGGTT